MREKLIDQLPPAAQDEIKGLQPYHRGDQAEYHPLWVIHRLSVTDKHKIVPGIGYEIRIPLGIGAYTVVTHGPLDDGAEILRFPALRADAEADFKPDFALHIVFEQGGWSKGTSMITFHTLYVFVRDDVLRRFERFFP